MYRHQLTVRDHEILRVLRSVRLLELSQIGDAWWKHSSTPGVNAYRRLIRLPEILIFPTYVKRIRVTKPLFSWGADSRDEFDAHKIAYLAKKRWTETPLLRSHIAVLTGNRKPRSTEVSHDTALSEIYLRFYRQTEDDQLWQHEDSLPKNRSDRVRPDAVIMLLRPTLTDLVFPDLRVRNLRSLGCLGA